MRATPYLMGVLLLPREAWVLRGSRY